MIDAMNKLRQWSSVLAGWHVGSQTIFVDGAPAMRDLMDKWLVMRSETNALATLLIERGVFTSAELHAQVDREAAGLDAVMETQFPGFRTTENGIVIEDVELANATMRRLHFPSSPRT